MDRVNANVFWKRFAGNWALVSVALVASIGLAATANVGGGETN